MRQQRHCYSIHAGPHLTAKEFRSVFANCSHISLDYILANHVMVYYEIYI
jgi:hypothetical protein